MLRGSLVGHKERSGIVRFPVFVSIEDGHVAQMGSAEWFSAAINYYGSKAWDWLRHGGGGRSYSAVSR